MSSKRFAAWLLDLDGTLYTASWVKLAMAAELALSGLGAISVLRRFRHEHESIRLLDPKDAGNDPFGLQLRRAAEGVGKPVEAVDAVVREWMFQRPAKALCGSLL